MTCNWLPWHSPTPELLTLTLGFQSGALFQGQWQMPWNKYGIDLYKEPAVCFSFPIHTSIKTSTTKAACPNSSELLQRSQKSCFVWTTEAQSSCGIGMWSRLAATTWLLLVERSNPRHSIPIHMQVVLHLVKFVHDLKTDGLQLQTVRLYAQIRPLRINSSTVSKAPMSLCTPFLRVCTRRLTGLEVTKLSPGIQLPNDLVLVHEHSDHYSLQAAKEMSLQGTSNHEAHRPLQL